MTESRSDIPRTAPDLAGEPDAEALAGTWDLLGDVHPRRPPAPSAVDAAWARLEARLFADGEAPPAPGESSGGGGPGRAPARRATPWLRLAASLALLAAAGAGAWSLVPATAQAGPGERLAVVLPGGSAVELNAGSSIRWARGFSWVPGVPRGERVVRLEGEAYFDVVTDGRPFRVRTADARVRVLGTRFNVRARPGEGTTVTVDEGSVEVRNADDAAVVLTAGERVVAGRGLFEAAAVESAPAWRTGGFSVSDARFASVVDELQRRFSTRIETGALEPATLERRLTLYYPTGASLEGVLHDVATALGLRYRQVAGGWEVLPAP
jgi:ferric-dicitrate binding protein FerR (iron transport regulator)